jgi:ATP-binding cassette subfamily B protein
MVTVGKMNPGHVVLMTGALPIIQLLNENLMELIEKKPVLDNLYARMEDIYSFADSSKGVAVDDIGELVFEDVSYTFDDENTTGKISFDYRNNEKILITGENGAGKTTFLNILLGLLPAYSGNITVNGKKFEEIDLDEWRRHICLVSQDPYIFKDTVRNNILLGESGIDEAVLKEAMDKFELSDFGDRIVTRESLSGGEKQRVSLARAYVRSPKLWIFDEPSNYLDETAKQRLADFINEIRGGVIMILHDRSVIDKIEFDKEVKVVKG